jgi:hypothetical protein
MMAGMMAGTMDEMMAGTMVEMMVGTMVVLTVDLTDDLTVDLTVDQLDAMSAPCVCVVHEAACYEVVVQMAAQLAAMWAFSKIVNCLLQQINYRPI